MNSKFLEIQDHLLNDKKPSEYLISQLNNNYFDLYPFSMIKDLESVEQNPKYHPEGNVFIHTMMVVDKGAENRNESNDKAVFMWALLLHDLGKKATTKIRNGRQTSYNHDIVGAEKANEFLKYFSLDEMFIRKVTALVRWHMQILFVNKNNKFQNIREMVKEVDTHEIVLVCMCDRLGRGGVTYNGVMNEVENLKTAIKKYSNEH